MKQILILLFLFTCFKGTAQTLQDCSTCSTQIIKAMQIQGLSVDEIRLLTNEIFARNGHQFDNSRFQEYFERKSWYQSKNDNKKVVFNDIEKKNILFFQEATKMLKTQQNELIGQLKTFKTLVLAQKTDELKSKFGFSYEKQTGEDEPNSLKEVMNKINLDDINFYKRKGINSVVVDNGFVKIVYEIALDGEKVSIIYNYMAHSKIIKDFDEFTDYHSEDEYLYEWQFNLKNNKLHFVKLLVAG